ncbi:MAG: hypothetical protein R3323_07765 [Wenzhouxiangellaceae bacterium]|nr:hypothetical protein [Wenzhouxiangellaceae bacterium]
MTKNSTIPVMLAGLLTAGAVALVALAACSSEPEPTESAPAETASTAGSEQESPRRGGATVHRPQTNAPTTQTFAANRPLVPDVDGQRTDGEGQGLLVVLDGTSEEAFEASLAFVAQDTTPEQYDELERALNYLVIYDHAILNDRARMLRQVDGMTAEEVIARASEIARSKQRNR